MKIKYTFPLALLIGFSGHLMAAECETTIEGNDAMRFNKSEITVDKSCEKFTINLVHTGKLAKNVMGHNVVITKAADANNVAKDGMGAGLDNQYVKDGDDRVIMHTDIVGGGEKTSETFEVSNLKEGESYEFFCSFPGHIALMKGKVVLN